MAAPPAPPTPYAGPTASAAVKEAARKEIEKAGDALTELSHRIWDNPELGFEEEIASEACADVLDGAGFDVTTGVAGLPTAFVAEYGSGPLTVGICSELDALPVIGHACGHNMIAAAGVGAGLGLARVADELGIKVKVFGTPAEEGGGGKIIMLEDGVFDGVNVAMMVHPAPIEGDVFPTLASNHCDYHFHGKTAHASMAPEVGINASDAVTIAEVSVGLLRQHLEPTDQVHGIVTNGGEAANIVPGYASARYVMRAPDLDSLRRLVPRIDLCFEAGALATGARLEQVGKDAPYSEFRHDPDVADIYRANAVALGRELAPRSQAGAASTDMANVSLLMPTIHPTLGLDCLPAVNHQPEFAAHCRTPEADHATIQGAIAMAWTSLDAAAEGEIRERLLSADTTYGGRDDYPWRF
ncbi:MAG: M20 family metallopeptidase [Actinomycetia bacterium]|nr:M20 family metallopeptidase [Actinomycetes bacterium]MCP3911128.1 M20 family metallopeptidase [Actinomycetes bacterium]